MLPKYWGRNLKGHHLNLNNEGNDRSNPEVKLNAEEDFFIFFSVG
jgi:hypothetical protein